MTSTAHGPERVPAGAGDDGPGLGQGAAGAGDQHRQVGDGVGGLPVGPQRLGEDVVRDEVGPAHGEHPQQRAHLAAAECRGRHLLAVAADLEPPEQLQGQTGHGVIVLGPARTARNLQPGTPSVSPRPATGGSR